MSYNDFISSMSEEQRNAALETDNPVMIIAGAGSGKTRTLIGRFLHLVTPAEEGGLGADPSSIMMVTFTNKAAREMRERLHPVLEDLRLKNEGKIYKDPWIGTFHSLSLRILRIESERAGLSRNFSIFDDADARSLAEDVAESLGLDMFDVDDFFRDLELAKSRLLSADILARKNALITSSSEAGRRLSAMDQRWAKILGKFRTPRFFEVYSAYQSSLKEQNAVDFSDLLNTVTEIFRENPHIRDSWRSTFRHFMVDEVQDINRAQAAWLNMFTDGAKPMKVDARTHENSHASAEDGMHEINGYRVRMFPRPTVAFVGDDDQSIYAFRGSDISIMHSMAERYEGIQMRYLTASYRCQPAILNVANALISNNEDRFPKAIQPADPDRLAYRVMVESHPSPLEEVAALRSEAARYMISGRDPSEFAILVRTRDLARVVAKEFRAAGLPVVEGKASDIRKSAEVKDAMSLAGFLINPGAETLLRRIINKPSRGLGPTSLTRVSRNARQKNISFIDELRSVMNDRIDLPEGAEPYKPAFIRAAKNFGRLVVQLRAQISSAENAADALLGILEATGYLTEKRDAAMRATGISMSDGIRGLPPREFLTRLLQYHESAKSDPEKGDQTSLGDLDDEDIEDLTDRAGGLSEAARRIGNLSILLEQARHFATLDDFIQESTLEMDQSEAQSGFRVMTIHASKGLEFDRVRLPFWNEGIMPHSRSADGNEEEIAEERRLAYVALTRARETVRISSSVNVAAAPFIRMRFAKASPFLKEIRGALGTNLAEREIRSSGHSCYTSSAPFSDLMSSSEEVPQSFRKSDTYSRKSTPPTYHRKFSENPSIASLGKLLPPVARAQGGSRDGAGTGNPAEPAEKDTHLPQLDL